ncbi:MAG: neutral/alkaline non-lysosomal ceramidase N-terminal domain-containing protein, partial [Planctomycetia bacterium]|nr:neutral/alkaline non-lysosomal ceramidase N-terminal domain-containing protein [Planctomycetia bacterium]
MSVSRLILLTVFAVIGLITQTTCAAEVEPLRVGAASVNITPEPGVRLGGYGMRYTPSTGVRSNIFARVLTLQKGNEQVVWIVCDLLCVDWKDAQLIQAKIAKKHGIAQNRIIVSATHTHSAPATVTLGPPKEEGYVYDFLIPRICNAVDQALASVEVCSVVQTQGCCQVAHDRRNDRVVGDGGAPNPDKKFAFIDERVPAIGFKRADGSFKTILVQYAMHPTSWGDTNMGAEWPGAVTVAIKRTFGDQVEPFVLQGGAGNLGSPKRKANPEEMQSWGDDIVASIGNKLKEAKASDNVPFAFAYENLSIAIAAPKDAETIKADAASWKKTYGKSPDTLRNMVEPWEKIQLAKLKDGTIGSVPSNTALVAIGSHVFVTTPFETFAQLNREIALAVAGSNSAKA